MYRIKFCIHFSSLPLCSFPLALLDLIVLNIIAFVHTLVHSLFRPIRETASDMSIIILLHVDLYFTVSFDCLSYLILPMRSLKLYVYDFFPAVWISPSYFFSSVFLLHVSVCVAVTFWNDSSGFSSSLLVLTTIMYIQRTNYEVLYYAASSSLVLLPTA